MVSEEEAPKENGITFDLICCISKTVDELDVKPIGAKALPCELLITGPPFAKEANPPEADEVFTEKLDFSEGPKENDNP